MINGYLRHLANFARVIEAGSITGAANRFGASPSAMSESVKIIETYCGESLLERHRRGVVPTSRGLALYEHAKVMTEAAERALRLGKHADEPAIVRVSVPVELASAWFHDAFATLHDGESPLRVVVMCEDEVLDHQRYSRDLFVRGSTSREKRSLNVLHEHRTQAIFCAHPDLLGGIDVDDLNAVQTLPFLCPPLTGPRATFRLPGRPEANRPVLRFADTLQVSDIQTRIALARRGLGVVGCLRPTVREELASGTLVQLAPAALTVPVRFTIGTPFKLPSANVRHVAETLSGAMKAA